MSVLNIAGRQLALDGLDIAAVSLHSAYHLYGLPTELVGGTPAYARQPIVMAQDIPGVLAMVGDAPIIFDVPAGSTVSFLGLWASDGTFRGMLPFSSTDPILFVLNPANKTELLAPRTTFVLGTQVVLWGGPLVLPLAADFTATFAGGIYWIVGLTTNGVQLGATQTDPPMLFEFGEGGYMQPITPINFATQSTFAVSNVIIDG